MTSITAYNTQAARSEVAEGALLADGFEDALIGFGYRFCHPTAVYSRKKCIEILMDDGIMEYEEAIEYFDFNVTGAYMGESTPVFLDDEFDESDLE
jgi:hypothetical protein